MTYKQALFSNAVLVPKVMLTNLSSLIDS